jgi:hypothetical protein
MCDDTRIATPRNRRYNPVSFVSSIAPASVHVKGNMFGNRLDIKEKLRGLVPEREEHERRREIKIMNYHTNNLQQILFRGVKLQISMYILVVHGS